MSRRPDPLPTPAAGSTRPADSPVLEQAWKLLAASDADSDRSRGIADILGELDLDPELEVAGILFPAVESGKLSLATVGEAFSETVVTLVDDMTRMPGFSDLGHGEQEEGLSESQAEALRQMLLAMARDIRVVVLRLADQLHVMRHLRKAPDAERRRAALATRELYAPLANRLGIWQLKWELEDLSLRFLDPDSYHQIARQLRETRAERERYIASVVDRIREEMSKAGIEAEVQGRPKHIYSIWKKMRRKGISFEDLFDVRAVRILVNTVPECYAALGVVHGLWRHIAHEFDDYIANPKENDYRSLHTAVFGPEDRPLEIQIRTWDMHRHSELGVAAHWRYKEGGGRSDPALEQRIAWLRQLLEPAEGGERSEDLLDRFRSEAFEDRIYALTPHGDIIDLPAHATPVDFAYHVHTQVGHRCRGAKVNGRIVPLDHQLSNGDRVEILTGKNERPSRDWLAPRLGYTVSNRARSKIRLWFRQQNQEDSREQGAQVLEREIRRLGMDRADRERLVQDFKYQSLDELLMAIGRGDLTGDQVSRRLSRQLEPADLTVDQVRTRASRAAQGGVRVLGVGELATTMSRCCHPVPGDPIIGFITRGRGVSIHRRDCRNLLNLAEDQNERLIDVSWDSGSDKGYAAGITVTAWDRHGLLRDITTLLGNEGVNITDVRTQTNPRENQANVRLTVELKHVDQLSQVLQKLNQLSNVIDARREVNS
ncbi:GTP diphosphokinase [Natronospira bacteriovora]|uniref:GTP pyrophosphokinase n=1 Tax=Natronospira bacteriovora TaxID=3069753 RepID=A0ABU0W3C5_9GAMM|nr:GTP diphosphokinase [Natronospira sp. AB-CW4]MDQ2068517.1 GTP diphosphokinase [Natronospira sp. AB-CW4]